MVDLAISVQSCILNSVGNSKMKYALLLNETEVKDKLLSLSKVVNDALKNYLDEYADLIKDREKDKDKKITYYGLISVSIPVDFNADEHKAIHDKYEADFKKVEDVMNDTITVELHQITIENVPDDINTIIMKSLMPMICDKM
jgi:hypothetical protein